MDIFICEHKDTSHKFPWQKFLYIKGRMCACMCLCVQNPVSTYVCVGCAQMHEDIWEIHKEVFTVLPPGSDSQSQRRGVRILYFILYILLRGLIFKSKLYMLIIFIKCNCL